jgi:hypothetical protein
MAPPSVGVAVLFVPPLAIGKVPLTSAVEISKASQDVLVPSVFKYLPELPV